MAQGPFSGIAATLSAVFGGPVTITPAGNPARDIQAVFRNTPVDIEAENGVSIQASTPTLRAHIGDVADLFEGDPVDPKNGKIYKYVAQDPPESPAPDALVTVHLMEV
jgi:hypothetical protein